MLGNARKPYGFSASMELPSQRSLQTARRKHKRPCLRQEHTGLASWRQVTCPEPQTALPSRLPSCIARYHRLSGRGGSCWPPAPPLTACEASASGGYGPWIEQKGEGSVEGLDSFSSSKMTVVTSAASLGLAMYRMCHCNTQNTGTRARSGWPFVIYFRN